MVAEVVIKKLDGIPTTVRAMSRYDNVASYPPDIPRSSD
jgi:hypothetical protein